MKEEGLVAVIIGIDGYKDRRVKPLQCAVNDAVSLTETLQKVWHDRRVNIKILIWPNMDKIQGQEERAGWGVEIPKDANHITRQSILSTVQESASLVQSEDTFIFYFSGHGGSLDEESALITVGDGKTAQGTEYIKISEIQEAAVHCASRKKIMILDASQPIYRHNEFSGYKNLKKLIGGWTIFQSCSPGEVCLEDTYFGDSRDDYLQQGIFTASLVEGLRGGVASSSDALTLAELFHFVSKRVPIEYQERINVWMKRETSGFPSKKKPETVKSQLKASDRDKEKEKMKEEEKVKTESENKPVKERDQERPYADRRRSSQNPVLISNSFALGGPYQVIMAPAYSPGFQGGRRKLPGRDFENFFYEFLLGQWPIQFPHRFFLRGVGAFLYALTVLFILLKHSPVVVDNTFRIFLGGAALGSAFFWWIIIPFTVAINEDRWYSGGFLPTIFYLGWHGMIALCFSGLGKIEPNQLFSLILHLFIMFLVVVVFGCNTIQTIIVLSEHIRTDYRREIRQAIRAFQQFKHQLVGVDVYKYVPIVPARPDLYLYIWFLSTFLIGLTIYSEITMLDPTSVTLGMLASLLSDIFALILVTWLVFWYLSAYNFIKRTVFER